MSTHNKMLCEDAYFGSKFYAYTHNLGGMYVRIILAISMRVRIAFFRLKMVENGRKRPFLGVFGAILRKSMRVRIFAMSTYIPLYYPIGNENI